MSTLPLTFALPDWFTSSFISSKLGISVRTVQHWCKTGLLTKRGYVVVVARDRGGKRYWIRAPRESRDAMLKHIHLTSFPN